MARKGKGKGKSKLVKKIKKTAKKVAKKIQSVAKTATKVVKKATKKAVIFTKSMDTAQTISLTADFIPIVENGKAAFETAFGFDPFTQDKLSAADRALGSTGILGGGYAKAIGKGALNFFSTGKNSTKTSESAAKSTTKNSKSATNDTEQKSSNKNTSSPTKGIGNPLLPGEGKVGTYEELIDAGTRGDNLRLM